MNWSNEIEEDFSCITYGGGRGGYGGGYCWGNENNNEG